VNRKLLTVLRKGVLGVLYGLVLASLTIPHATAAPPKPNRPFRGSVAWSVLLCTFSGSGTPPNGLNHYHDMLIRPGTGGLYDYWHDVSYGGIDFEESVIKGWYVEPFTFKEAKKRYRDQKFQDCIDAARNSPTDPYQVPDNHRILVITFPDVDLFGIPDRGAFLPDWADLGFVAHEVGHGLGLNHSFSDDPSYRNADWSQIGEYDDQWDLMSFANVFTTGTSRFGNSGPGLNAYHLDRMGWIPRSRIYTFGRDDARTKIVTLAALNHPEARGYLLVRVPFDPGDLFHYYTTRYPTPV
jgi:hypothetical protein